MLIRRFTSLLLISVLPLLAQISNNTVTVTASQSSTAQPVEAVFSVTVASGVDKSLDQIVAAVSGVGITAANLVTVNTAGDGFVTTIGALPPGFLGPQWIFQLVVPFSKLKERALINQRAADAGDGGDFSQRIRAGVPGFER